MDRDDGSVTDHGSGTLIEVAAGNVRVNGSSVTLTERERELAIAIAVHERSISAPSLSERLYPDRDPAQAMSIIKVYVCRLRKRIGQEFIVLKEAGYALGPQVSIDLHLGRKCLDRLSGSERSCETAFQSALTLARGLRAQPPFALATREWFIPVQHCARRVGHQLAVALGRDSLRRGAADETLRIGTELTYEDPCDEEAWELVIRGHIQLQQYLSAAQSFRFYEKALASELNAAPSPHLRRLLEETTPRPHPASLSA